MRAGAERVVLWRVEAAGPGGRYETLGWWPDGRVARAIAGHYRRELAAAGGRAVVRVRRERAR